MLKISTIAVFVMLLWAICYPLITLSLPFAPVMLTAFLRALLAGLLLVFIALIYRRPWPNTRRTWAYIAAIGFCATSIGFWGMFFAGSLLSPGLATVLTNTQPLIAGLLGWFFLKEYLGPLAILAISLGFFGILIISGESILQNGGENASGVLYVMVAAAGIALSNILLKRVANDIDILYAMGFQLLIGSIPLGLLSLSRNEFAAFDASTTYAWLLAVMVVFGTAMPFVLWYWLMDKAPLYKLNMFSFLSPVFGMYLGVVYFSEVLTHWQWAGVAVVAAAIVLASTTHAAPERGQSAIEKS